MSKWMFLAPVAAVLMTLTACGGGGSSQPKPNPNPPQAVTVSVNPQVSSLTTGGTQTFTATVTGTSNTSVNWSCSGGTITYGTYTAPSTAGNYTVTATSVSDSTKSATANVTVTTPPPVVTYTAIPDVNFQNALIAQGIPVANGQVSSTDAAKVTYILIQVTPGPDGTYQALCGGSTTPPYGEGGKTITMTSLIQSLQGIEAFTNLTWLQLNHNNLANSPDLSHNTNLTFLDLWDCGLTTLDVTALTKLQILGISTNPLETIDLSRNTALTDLAAQHLNALDSPDTPWGVTLGLTSLDLTHNINLQRIYLSANRIQTLDLSRNTQLVQFWASTGKFTSLDFSNNHNLKYVIVPGNQLTYLNLRGSNPTQVWTCQNTTYNSSLILGNPNLTQILVSQLPASKIYYGSEALGVSTRIDWWVDATTQVVAQ